MVKLRTIKKNKEYQRVFKNGYSAVNRRVVMIARKNEEGITRFGFSVSKKIGNAVTRNRVRRLFKEVCRLYMHVFKPGYDYVIIARKGSSYCNFYHMKNNVLTLAKKLNKKIDHTVE